MVPGLFRKSLDLVRSLRFFFVRELVTFQQNAKLIEAVVEDDQHGLQHKLYLILPEVVRDVYLNNLITDGDCFAHFALA